MYLNGALSVELLLVSSAGGCNEVNKFHLIAVYLHLIVRMDDKLRLTIGIDKTFTVVWKISKKMLLSVILFSEMK